MKMRPTPLLAAALLTLLLARSASADTIYSNLQDIAIPTNFAGVYLDIETGATATSAFTGWDINPFFGGSAIGNSAAFQPVRIGTSNLDRVLNLAAGSVISGSLTYASGFGGSGNSGHEHIGAGADQFPVGTEGYLGFQFTTNASSGPLFGWMRVTLTNNAPGAMIKDWGYDDAGGPIVVGRVQQSAAVANAQTVTLSPGASESFTLGSAITDTGGNTNSVLKTGAGTTRLTTANTFTGSTSVSGGTLEAVAAAVLGQTASVAVNSGGTLLLSGTGDRINDAAGVTLAGGTFETGGLAESVGALTLSASSIIDFGTGNFGNALTFANSSALAGSWVGMLSIYNWTGTVGIGGGPDRLFFGTDGSGLDVGQSNQISFYSGAGMGFLGTGSILATGEVVPIPEPSTVLLAACLVTVSLAREGGRRKR